MKVDGIISRSHRISILFCTLTLIVSLWFEKACAANNLSSAEIDRKEGEISRNVSTASPSNHTSTRNLSSVLSRNREALIRSAYVFGGLCILVIIYMGFKSLRLRNRKSSKRNSAQKYLPLSSGRRSGGVVPFEDDEDEDEDTLFESTHPSGSGKPS